jgi:hypothetical protein
MAMKVFWVATVCNFIIISEEHAVFRVENGGSKLSQTVIKYETTQFYNTED